MFGVEQFRNEKYKRFSSTLALIFQYIHVDDVSKTSQIYDCSQNL